MPTDSSLADGGDANADAWIEWTGRALDSYGSHKPAIGRSATMVRTAATHPEEPVPAVVADAVDLPIPAGAADCVVAFMSLHDIDEVEQSITERRTHSRRRRFI